TVRPGSSTGPAVGGPVRSVRQPAGSPGRGSSQTGPVTGSPRSPARRRGRGVAGGAQPARAPGRRPQADTGRDPVQPDARRAAPHAANLAGTGATGFPVSPGRARVVYAQGRTRIEGGSA